MENIILFLIAFLFTSIGRFILYLVSKRRKKTKKKSISIVLEIKYLENRFKLNTKKTDKNSIAFLISLLDGIIVGMTLLTVISITDNLILELAIGLVVAIVFIFVIYEVLGRILLWRGYDK